MAVGLITEAKQAEDIVASGKADMVALARAMLYDPRWGWHAAAELNLMSTVYLAEDLRHDRMVAVKVLRPELAAVIGAERFLLIDVGFIEHPDPVGRSRR